MSDIIRTVSAENNGVTLMAVMREGWIAVRKDNSYHAIENGQCEVYYDPEKKVVLRQIYNNEKKAYMHSFYVVNHAMKGIIVTIYSADKVVSVFAKPILEGKTAQETADGISVYFPWESLQKGEKSAASEKNHKSSSTVKYPDIVPSEDTN